MASGLLLVEIIGGAMKIDRLRDGNIPDSITIKDESTPKPVGKVVEEKAQEPVQLQRPLPKADSVEMKESSVYLDKITAGPKLDPSKTNLAKELTSTVKEIPTGLKEVPAALIPGVPFREKVELSKTLPGGQAVDAGLVSNLGIGKTWTGPNRMGVDLGVGGVDVKSQLDDALKLRQGFQSPSTPTGSETYQPVAGKADIGPFDRPGMEKISALKDGGVGDLLNSVIEKGKAILDKVVDYAKDISVEKFGKIPGTGEAMDLLDAPGKVKEVTGDTNDLPRGISAVLYPESRLDKIEDAADEENKYVNPIRRPFLRM
ncbi:hypothetical protein L0222_31180 [bacterium]|nr:hypothetical protein [bacterium]MCI0606382.1 hypothetical protein [bacterium]